VQSSLTELIREEVIEKTPERRFANETKYRFRHALVRDAAYGLVSTEEKVAWHTAAGEFLEGIGELEAVVPADRYCVENPVVLGQYKRHGWQNLTINFHLSRLPTKR
jgi:hypothetical protein